MTSKWNFQKLLEKREFKELSANHKNIINKKIKKKKILFGGGEREWFFDFGNGNGNSSTHSQILGMGMKNSIPNFWEWERE